MRLIFMRHADCKGIKEGVINGWRDYPLTAKGKKEPLTAAKDIQMLLGTVKLDKVYTSYLSRTYDTACIFAGALNYKGKIVRDLRLNERHYGMFQGMKRDDAKAFPEYNTLSEKKLDLENKLVPENELRHCATLNEYSEKLGLTIKKLEKRKCRLQRSISRKYLKNKEGGSYCKTSNIVKSEKLLLKVNHRLINIRKNLPSSEYI